MSIDVKLWISRGELEVALKGLNHCLRSGVFHARIPMIYGLSECMTSVHKPPWQSCPLPAICGWLWPLSGLFRFSFHTDGSALCSFQIEELGAIPNESNTFCFLLYSLQQLLRFLCIVLGKKLVLTSPSTSMPCSWNWVSILKSAVRK